MSKTYLPYEPDQQLLLPAALQEWLPDDHLAYFISDVVDQLDMSKVTARSDARRAGTARRAAVSSTDDGQGVALRHTAWGWRPHAASPSVSTIGHRLQGVGGEQHAGLPDHLRLSQG